MTEHEIGVQLLSESRASLRFWGFSKATQDNLPSPPFDRNHAERIIGMYESPSETLEQPTE